jgi:choline dehydrogenase
VERLRVIDASSMPFMPTANITAATIMLAERASDLVLGLPTMRAEPLQFVA